MINTLFKSKKNKVASPSSELAHNAFFEALRTKEYSRLDKGKHVYLDFTGGNLYADSQVVQHHTMLRENVLGNPHSTNPSSQLATKLVEEARRSVIDFFNADDYHCIFTPNASGSLKIVGECYPFEEDGCFMLFSDNHNSVNGIREYCKNHQGTYHYVPMNYTDLSVDAHDLTEKLEQEHNKNRLFAFPAQSNVSGVKHDLSWIKKAKDHGWDVLLDAAAFAPTSKLDLSVHQPDFVTISFYKIFGYPTGLGCLLIKKSTFPKLRKRWFAGGTVSLASVNSPHHFLINNHERFEDGTINYLDIPAIKMGLDYINGIGIERITERVKSLTDYLHAQLQALQHSNGESQLEIFGAKDRTNAGGTMIMNFKNPDGSKIPFEKFEELTNTKMISIRSGCFCNPGLDEINNCLTVDEIANYFSSRETGNYWDMIDYLKKMRGATRVSVGIATTQKDLDAFVSFLSSLKDTTVGY